MVKSGGGGGEALRAIDVEVVDSDRCCDFVNGCTGHRQDILYSGTSRKRTKADVW